MTAPSLNVKIQGQGSVSADDLNTYTMSCDTLAQLRAFSGAPGIQVYARGTTAVGDGGQGFFAWIAGGTGVDNNSTIIVPSGGGGIWERMSTDSGAIISAAMTPVVQAATLALGRAALGAASSLGAASIADATVGGTANAITLTYAIPYLTYATGQKYAFKATAPNTGPATVNVSGLGNKNIFIIANGTPTALNGNEIANGAVVEMEYDGTQMQLLNPSKDEGSWTPAYFGDGTAGTFTYTQQVGRYIRIGNLVWVTGRVTISAISVAPTGNLSITGLPFTSSSTAQVLPTIPITRMTGITLTASYTWLAGEIATNGTSIILFQNGSAQASAQLQGGAIGATGDVICSGIYRIN